MTTSTPDEPEVWTQRVGGERVQLERDAEGNLIGPEGVTRVYVDTSTLTVTDFLAARIAEDEAAARACLSREPGLPKNRQDRSWTAVDLDADTPMAGRFGHVANRGMTIVAWPDEATHIARHDPARVLAQCAAMRKIVEDLTSERHEVVEGDCWFTCGAATEERDGGETCDDSRRGTGCDCGRDTRVNRRLGLIASIWSSHPDWREAWRA